LPVTVSSPPILTITATAARCDTIPYYTMERNPR
jgi:hypothetical protein